MNDVDSIKHSVSSVLYPSYILNARTEPFPVGFPKPIVSILSTSMLFSAFGACITPRNYPDAQQLKSRDNRTPPSARNMSQVNVPVFRATSGKAGISDNINQRETKEMFRLHVYIFLNLQL